jgi:hypothetical protein
MHCCISLGHAVRAPSNHRDLTKDAEVPVGSRLSISSSPGDTTNGADSMLCLASSCCRDSTGHRARQQQKDLECASSARGVKHNTGFWMRWRAPRQPLAGASHQLP